MFGGEATVVRGQEGLLAYVRDLDEGFDVRDVQWSEFRDLGDRIVVLGHVRARGRWSGVEFDSPYGGSGRVQERQVPQVQRLLRSQPGP
jgi:hypothetical protein